jgi:hypothetical protein
VKHTQVENRKVTTNPAITDDDTIDRQMFNMTINPIKEKKRKERANRKSSLIFQ